MTKVKYHNLKKFDCRSRCSTDRLSADASISPENPLSEKASERVVSFFEWVFLTGSLQGRRRSRNWRTYQAVIQYILFVYQRNQGMNRCIVFLCIFHYIPSLSCVRDVSIWLHMNNTSCMIMHVPSELPSESVSSSLASKFCWNKNTNINQWLE